MEINNQKKEFEGYFYPILASIENDSSQARLDKWEKFDRLSEILKYKLSSKNTADKIKSTARSFNLDLEHVDGISGAVRDYYFGEFRLEDLPSIVSRRTGLDLVRAKEIYKMIVEKIINDKSFEEAYQASLEKIPLQEALKKFPELGEQLITADKITLKNFPSPVRPSIKNWLADYNFVAGFAKKEGSIGRTNYLFHNINTQKMSSSDRQKLSYILKAFDENSLITVNKNSQQVVFPDLQEKPPIPAPPKKFEAPSGEKGGPDVRFTSPQKMPYEKEKDGTRQPYRITPFDTSPRDKSPDENSKPPTNIINLKE